MVILMLLATALVNHRNAYECALGTAACRAPAGGLAAAPLAGEMPGADRVARLIQSSPSEGRDLLTAHFSLYLLGTSLVLLAAALAAVVMVARQQWRVECAQRATDDAKAADAEKMLRLFGSVATVIRALEERTRELEAGVEAFASGSAAHERGLAAVAAVLVKVREDQRAGGEVVADTAEQIDRALASVTEELANSRQALINQLMPSIARRDERLVAIDANLTVVADRLSTLASDTQHNIRETAVLTEVIRALQKSVSGASDDGSAEFRRPPPQSPERPPEAAPSPAPSEVSEISEAPDEAVTSDLSPTADESPLPEPQPASDDDPGSDPKGAQAVPFDDSPADDALNGQPKNDG